MADLKGGAMPVRVEAGEDLEEERAKSGKTELGKAELGKVGKTTDLEHRFGHWTQSDIPGRLRIHGDDARVGSKDRVKLILSCGTPPAPREGKGGSHFAVHPLFDCFGGHPPPRENAFPYQRLLDAEATAALRSCPAHPLPVWAKLCPAV